MSFQSGRRPSRGHGRPPILTTLGTWDSLGSSTRSGGSSSASGWRWPTGCSRCRRTRPTACFESPALASVTLSVAAPGRVGPHREGARRGRAPHQGARWRGDLPRLRGPGRRRGQGQGETHVLRGAAVVVAGYLPRAQEAIVDMSGPAADLSPLGPDLQPGGRVHARRRAPPWEDVDVALRRGALRAGRPPGRGRPRRRARRGGGAASTPAPADGLPRVAALTNLQTQGTFKDVFVYGEVLRRRPAPR